MGNDIFGYNRQAKAGQLFDSEDSIVTITPGGNVFLGQNIEIEYTQQIAEVFEIGTRNIYWVGGRPSGVGSIARLMGPASNMLAAMAGMQLCNGGATMVANLGTPCPNLVNGTQTITCSGVVMTGKRYVLAVQQIVVAENLSMKIGKVEEA